MTQPADDKFLPRAARWAMAADDSMTMWVVYEKPSDFPSGFVVRKWEVVRGRELAGGAITAVTLHDARLLIPKGTVNIGRFNLDDATILEIWI